MTIASVIDLGLVALVATMIAYCVVLDRRLTKLRVSQADMGKLVATLLEAIKRAEATLAAFRANGIEEGARLGRLIDQARAVGDELAFLAERGDRSAAGMAERAERSPSIASAQGRGGRSRVEQDLAEALRAGR